MVIAVILVGAGFLYQREGGKIFGPNGALAPADPVVTGFDIKWDSGMFSHDLLLTNRSAGDLEEVIPTLTRDFWHQNATLRAGQE